MERTNSSIRSLLLLALGGGAFHALLVVALEGVSTAILPGDFQQAGSHWFSLYVTPWLFPVQSLSAGLLVGILARTRPMLTGFLAVCLGQLALAVGAIDLADPLDPMYFFYLLESTLPMALFGLVAAAAGFLLRGSFRQRAAVDGHLDAHADSS